LQQIHFSDIDREVKSIIFCFFKGDLMYQANEQLIALNKSNLEAVVRFAGIALEGAERMLEVQLKAAKSAFADGVQQAKALTEVKDVQEFAQLRNTVAQPFFEKATSYAKSVYDVAAVTQAEINKLVEEQVSEFNKQVVTGLDKIVKSAPAGSEVAVAAVKSAISAVNSAYDNISKSAKQFTEMTQANVEAATSQAVNVSKKKAA
jgi:phasin family protein